MATNALHVTFLWEVCKPDERTTKVYTDLETELAIAVDDADLFKVEVGEDILTAMQMFEALPDQEGGMDKKRVENTVAFCTAMAEVYMTVPIERQPTLTDTLFKAGVTNAIMSCMQANFNLKPTDSHLFSTLQMSCSTLLISMATKRSENDVTRTQYAHQRLCRQMIPVFQHMVYNSPCLATVLVLLKYLLMIGSTHKPFFNEVFEEFHGVVEEFLKPGVLLTHWTSRIPGRQIALLKALTPYMPGEVNCFVNILSWFVYEIPERGMLESDLDKLMEKESLLDTYWMILNEPIPSTYFRFAKSKVMMLYATLCDEAPQYNNRLIERYGLCPFLESLLEEAKLDKKCLFPLSCLARNMVICMNPLHADNIFPMDKAMELIYEDFGKEDGLIQTEVLQYIPGLKKKKGLQRQLGKLLAEFASELRYAFASGFAVHSERKKVKKTKSLKSVRFSGNDQDEGIEIAPEEIVVEEKKNKKKKKKGGSDHSKLEKTQSCEGILTKTIETQQTNLRGYLESLHGADYQSYLPTFANNGMYLVSDRKVFYNSVEEADRKTMEAVCTVCNSALNRIQCKACGFKYCSAACQRVDDIHHAPFCNLKTLEKSLHDAVVS